MTVPLNNWSRVHPENKLKIVRSRSTLDCTLTLIRYSATLLLRCVMSTLYG